MRGFRRQKPSASPPPPPRQSAARQQSSASGYNEKRVSQWEDLMRKFCEAHKEQCKTASLDMPRAHRSVKNLPTGSRYGGQWDVLGMSGYGTYTFPNGVIYEGDFDDGMFHGKGELQYDDGAVLKGNWKKGVMEEKTLLFSDSLEYKEEFWKYCVAPDRRFAIEYDIDVMPAGKSFLTAEQPTKVIPPGYYDSGDGFYCPKTKCVYKYDDLSAVMRSPSIREQKWIVDNCRVSPEEPLGPRPDLYERWSEPVLNPAPPPPPAAGVRSTVTTFRQMSIFDTEFDPSDTHLNFYDCTRRHSDSDGRSDLIPQCALTLDELKKKFK
ncbi:MORN repeat-containing protein 5-like isoform X2 [Trichoplusia ni]|uniref:MORN repeat-containing protein 5 n=1 Tax=Trichoplusia ni TaxID=7111 RepID=A0A7E5WUC7_TRINI|nr:MORN repeat-containing protein 5-like isoform X2 [Trichoplusia ni]